MSIHEQIKKRREALGWSMETLAMKVHELEGSKRPLSWQTVQQWESGKTAPARKRLQFVAQALRMTVEDMLQQETHAAIREPSLDYKVAAQRKGLSIRNAFEYIANELKSSDKLMLKNAANIMSHLAENAGDPIEVERCISQMEAALSAKLPHDHFAPPKSINS